MIFKYSKVIYNLIEYFIIMLIYIYKKNIICLLNHTNIFYIKLIVIIECSDKNYKDT